MQNIKRLKNMSSKELQHFLTRQKEEHKDMNAIITSGETLAALQLWRALGHRGVDLADDVADDLERLTKSQHGKTLNMVSSAMGGMTPGSMGQLGGAQPKVIDEVEEEE